jgi:hypothetical protein
MTDPDDFDLDYYQREADRGARALGLIGLLWTAFGGAVAGYVLARLIG